MKRDTFTVGLRVDDVVRASEFYTGLGFEQVGEVPAADGRPLLRILEQQGIHLVAESLDGPPMPDTDREAEVQDGPRGLGVVLGFEVEDLHPIFQYAIEWGCTITCEPMDEGWGHRVFTFVDPFGFDWEPTQQVVAMSVEEGNRAVAQNWAGASC